MHSRAMPPSISCSRITTTTVLWFFSAPHPTSLFFFFIEGNATNQIKSNHIIPYLPVFTLLTTINSHSLASVLRNLQWRYLNDYVGGCTLPERFPGTKTSPVGLAFENIICEACSERGIGPNGGKQHCWFEGVAFLKMKADVGSAYIVFSYKADPYSGYIHEVICSNQWVIHYALNILT